VDSRGWDVEWLDLTAELLCARPRALPVDRIAVQLATTLDSVACALAVAGEVQPRCRVWQLTQGTGRSYRQRQSPDWRAFFRSIGAEHQLRMAVNFVPGRQQTFVLGSTTPYSAAQVELTGTLQRLLIGIDRHLERSSDVTVRAGAPDRGLTPRETTVLALMASGMTAAAAARRLAIAERTINKHLERTYRKLEVTDRLSAVVRARGLGILD
jgi:DNA-binding CsgD family transcriptional regulator